MFRIIISELFLYRGSTVSFPTQYLLGVPGSGSCSTESLRVQRSSKYSCHQNIRSQNMCHLCYPYCGHDSSSSFIH